VAFLARARSWFGALLRNPYFWGGLVVLVGLGVGAYLAFDRYLMPLYTRHDASVQVPDVTSMPVEEAEATLDARDLTAQRQQGRYNPNVPRGTVVDQTPLPGRDVKPGRRVYLTVNSGEVPYVQVPDVGGLSVREAQNQLRSRNLGVGSTQPDTAAAPYPNTIVRQDPRPGDSLRAGEPVDLWFSPGLSPERVTVPRVTGLTVAAARDSLRRQRLRFVVVRERAAAQEGGAARDDDLADEAVAKARVQRQGRPPGSRVQAGTEIRLFVAPDSTQAP
jgi:beta-lactam-binding protein with PASTA domain